MDNPVILVVDDEPLNVKLLRSILSENGYEVLEASNGREALSLADHHPDLILLDLMMPEIDGFETCRRLKEDPETREIPVIFLSALQDPKYKIFGSRLGGADYITKPFDQGELLARVRTQLTISDQQTRLREYAERFQEMVNDKTCRLVQDDRLATVGTLAAAVVQEINDPLLDILDSAELIARDLAGLKERLGERAEAPGASPISDLTGKLSAHLERVSRGREKLDLIVRDLKGLGKKCTAESEVLPLELPVQEALQFMGPPLKDLGILEVDVPQELKVFGNRLQISRVFINLIQNALEALADKRGSLSIKAEADERQQIVIVFKDSGPGIPENLRDGIFDPFFTTRGDLNHAGLGLFIARQLLERQRGTIQAISHEGPGAWFQIILPGAWEADLHSSGLAGISDG